MKMKCICHVTSVHPRYDVRIFIKECVSLSSRYNVFLIVADGKGDERKNNITILDVGKPKSRLKRIFFTGNLIFKKAIALNAEVYHFHDPELMPIAVKIKKIGKKVIFDAHEDFPKQLLSKAYLPPIVAKIFSFFATFYEGRVFKKIDAAVCATPAINKKILKYNKKGVSVCNYPILSELYTNNTIFEARLKQACYIGGISLSRGLKQLTDSAYFLAHRGCGGNFVVIAGKTPDLEFMKIIKKSDGYEYVNFIGELNREQVRMLLAESYLGIVTLLSTPNHVESLPIKMFEYMSAGIPVIASNFPLWKEIIEENRCGICVNPESPNEISDAIDYLFSNCGVAEEMGKNGRRAVEEKYNWEAESVKLINLYKEILL